MSPPEGVGSLLNATDAIGKENAPGRWARSFMSAESAYYFDFLTKHQVVDVSGHFTYKSGDNTERIHQGWVSIGDLIHLFLI